ncbi:class I SAM-dependent methyltransferase [Legionella hackeliae]|uniref:Uncharacterized protein n=1 Tax=Legionella hackeliae TaxID=449 RepID=A0A0A8UT40_LEGHA|nr:class I SAM-dependent methyltransferase [Legionella hackeliae]KTD08824.1 Ubiquinone biosynthesis O-methyltransferase [Legionella hackeliae]CEK10252.1 conserved protein of unknown function [Legionella hackeliae]STX46981.1 3-demethylubiquinone-9 3-methyltransferase [Legionella hackeliae]
MQKHSSTTYAKNLNLRTELELFIQTIPIELIIDKTTSTTQFTPEQIKSLLNTYINETRVSFSLIEKYLAKELNLLEVGAGLCLLSIFLKQQGFKITALEPSLGGFELFSEVKPIILDCYSDVNLPVLEITAESLNSINEKYDVIFSNNVIEHIPNLSSALDSMLSVLTPTGKMIHSCPNYLVPYEPHFQIFVIKPLKNISEYLFKSKINSLQNIWDSLNFVTYTGIKAYARKRKLRYNFRKGLLYEALMRMRDDTEFRQRHFHIMIIYSFLKYTGLIRLFKHLPACLSTPMIFEITKH